MNRNLIFAILLALAILAALGAGPAAAQRHLSTELLLPSFEVDLSGQGMTTLWSVTNTLDQPVATVATVYSNWGIPVLSVPVDLDPHQVRTFNLRDWIVAGNLPDGPMSADALSELQATLSGQASPKDGLFYSNPTVPDRAMGYLILRLVANPERPAALFGDFFVMGPGKAAAAGDTLVDLDTVASCSDLCSRHALRFLSGALFDNGTELIVWTPGAGQPAVRADDPADATVTAHARLYDETGQLMGERQIALHPLSIVGMSELTPSGPFGWVDLDLGTRSFVGVRYSGKTSDSVAFQSTCLPDSGGPPPPPLPPGLSIRKLTNGIHSDATPGATLAVGSAVTWSYVVKNNGQVPLTQVSVTDDQGVAVHCPQTTLSVGEEMTCTGTGTAVACQYKNTGTVSAYPAQGAALSAQDVSYYYGDPAAALTLTLSLNGQRATTAPGIEVAVGSTLSWTYLVTNTGKSLLTGITVTDDQGVAATCPRGRLAPGASMTCSASGTAASGQHGNVGTAAGQPPCGTTVTAQDRSYYHTHTSCSAHPAIQIRKSTNSQHATAAPGLTIATGAAVTWTYEVTNTGDVTLSNVAVTDDRQGAVACPRSSLTAGQTMTCTAHGTAVSGQYRNVGTATGQPSCGSAASASDSGYYYGQDPPKPPGISIKKYTNSQYVTSAPGPHLPLGSAVTWTYVVTNTGQVALSNVRVTDNRGVAVACPKAALAVGETMTCSGYGTAAACQYSNTGEVYGTSPAGETVSAEDESWYFGDTHPAIAIEKYTNGQHATAAPGPTIAAGAAVTWTYEVTNTGDVTLGNVAVTDDRQGTAACPRSTLAAGETMTCTAHGTAVSGQYENVGTATGQAPCGSAVSAHDTNYYYGQSTPPPPPPPSGNQGCSPGYWKNHSSSWSATGYSTGQSVLSVFQGASHFPSLGGATLLQALAFQGGSGLDGAAQILLHAGVAALLNAADPQIAYPRQPQDVISSVNSALASNDRGTMTTLAGQLDTDNNLYCPLH